MFRKKNVLRAAAPVAVLGLALALTGCQDSGTDKPSDQGKAGQATESTESGGSSGSSGSDGSGESTEDKPEGDAALKPGESGTGVFKEEIGEVTYEIAAQKIDVSTEAEAQKLVSDPADAKGLVAVTAQVEFTHKSGATVESSPDVGGETEVYADGTRGGLLIGAAEDAAGCDDTLDIENWKAGQSYTLCETYMVPTGAKSIEVRWAEEGGDGKTLSWAFENK